MAHKPLHIDSDSIFVSVIIILRDSLIGVAMYQDSIFQNIYGEDLS